MKVKTIYLLLLSVLILLLINVSPSKAQGLPCGDPDLDCPIDEPVIIFAVLMLFLALKKLRTTYAKVEIEIVDG